MSADRLEIDPLLFRRVLGEFPTGVVVVCADGPQGPSGMACNSFASVSIDPPLVSFCAARSSETWPVLREAGRFCINVLAAHHEDTCRTFARKGIDRFAGVPVLARRGGPALQDAVAWIDCELQDEHDAGDHTIVVARVLELEAREGSDALVFWRGAYGQFAALT